MIKSAEEWNGIFKELNAIILEERTSGSVADEDSGLLDYWGSKNVAGIVTMPLTRRLLVHLNSAYRMV